MRATASAKCSPGVAEIQEELCALNGPYPGSHHHFLWRGSHVPTSKSMFRYPSVWSQFISCAFVFLKSGPARSEIKLVPLIVCFGIDFCAAQLQSFRFAMDMSPSLDSRRYNHTIYLGLASFFSFWCCFWAADKGFFMSVRILLHRTVRLCPPKLMSTQHISKAQKVSKLIFFEAGLYRRLTARCKQQHHLPLSAFRIRSSALHSYPERQAKITNDMTRQSISTHPSTSRLYPAVMLHATITLLFRISSMTSQPRHSDPKVLQTCALQSLLSPLAPQTK